MTSAQIAALSDPTVIEQAADPAQYVVLACERAKAWLADALAHGEIDRIVEIKSSAEAIRVYTAQKQIGKDAELSAAEIVRRAERGLGLAIRRGQEAGEIKTRQDGGWQSRNVDVHEGKKKSPADYLSNGKETTETYAITDGVSDDQFEQAVSEAREEGNLSRSNMVRKIRAKREARESRDAAMAEPESAVELEGKDSEVKDWIPQRGDNSHKAATRRRELIAELGGRGWTSQQIGERIGVLDSTIRRIARAEGITIQADRAMGRGTRKSIDSNRIIRETVASVDGLEMALDLVDYDELDVSEVENWTVSLTHAIRVLNRLNKRLKETIQ